MMKKPHIYSISQLNEAIEKEVAYAEKLISECDFVGDADKCREVIEFIVCARLTQLYTFDQMVAEEAEIDEIIAQAKKDLELC